MMCCKPFLRPEPSQCVGGSDAVHLVSLMGLGKIFAVAHVSISMLVLRARERAKVGAELSDLLSG